MNEIWSIIPEIDSILQYGAIVVAVIAYILITKIRRKQKLIKTLPEGDRAKALQDKADELGISAQNIQDEEKMFQLVMESMRQKTKLRMALLKSFFFVSVIILAGTISQDLITSNSEPQLSTSENSEQAATDTAQNELVADTTKPPEEKNIPDSNNGTQNTEDNSGIPADNVGPDPSNEDFTSAFESRKLVHQNVLITYCESSIVDKLKSFLVSDHSSYIYLNKKPCTLIEDNVGIYYHNTKRDEAEYLKDIITAEFGMNQLPLSLMRSGKIFDDEIMDFEIILK